MSRNVSAARAHSAIKSHIPTMHQPTLWWRKISIIRVSSCWRWRVGWGGLRLDSLPVFSTATHSKSAATPPHIPTLSPQPPLRQTIIIFPPISVPLHVSTAANIIREVSASAPHSGKSNLPRFPSAELRCSFKQGQQGKKHWVKDDDVHAGKKGSAVRVVEGGGGLAMRATTYMCRLHERRHKKRYNTQQKKNTTKDTRRLRWRKHRTVLGPTVMAAGTKLYSLRLSSPD